MKLALKLLVDTYSTHVHDPAITSAKIIGNYAERYRKFLIGIIYTIVMHDFRLY